MKVVYYTLYYSPFGFATFRHSTSTWIHLYYTLIMNETQLESISARRFHSRAEFETYFNGEGMHHAEIAQKSINEAALKISIDF